jgi:hypothetical protein
MIMVKKARSFNPLFQSGGEFSQGLWMSVSIRNSPNSAGEERFPGKRLSFKCPEILDTEAVDGQVYCAWRVCLFLINLEYATPG